MNNSSIWTRDITWRQGHVLKVGTAISLGLIHPAQQEDACVVVVSHDCDLANDNLDVEPNVELIVGRVVPEINGNFTWGKSPRTLHLEMLRDGKPVTVELVSTSKALRPKVDLASHAPDAAFSLPRKGLVAMRSWLAIRYNRAAFSDTFVKRMKEKNLDAKLAKLMEQHGQIFSAVYFDVDGGEEIDRGNDEPYELNIVLAFDTGDDPDHAMDVADNVESEVQKLFSDRCFDQATEEWTRIHLKKCVAISEDDMTVRDAKMLSQWRLEHISFKSDDEQPSPVIL